MVGEKAPEHVSETLLYEWELYRTGDFLGDKIIARLVEEVRRQRRDQLAHNCYGERACSD